MRSVFLLLGAALIAAPPKPAHAQGQAASKADSLGDEVPSRPRPDIRLLRQEEDWSALAAEEGGLASLKYVPLADQGNAFLTIGGEARTYGRWYRNEQWGAGPARDGYLLQRLMLHTSVRANGPGATRLRAFTQLKSGLVGSRDGPIYPPDKDLLGINQAFLELRAPVAEGHVSLRFGRQELHYGAGRMIAVREGPNVRLGYDAVLGRYRRGPWRADLFAAKPNDTSPGILDNGWMRGRTLWGLHLSRHEGKTRKGSEGQSLYYFGTRRTPSPTGAGLRATRHTVGGRRHGAVGTLRYDLEGAVQLGRYRRPSAPGRRTERAEPGSAETGPIRAWTLSGRISYGVEDAPGGATLGLLADWSSGDARDTKALGTFAAPYPSGRFTGAGSRLGPGNLINAAPFLALRLPGGVRLQLKNHFFWRSSPTDGIYAVWGAPLRTDPGTNTRYIGAMPEAILSVDAGRHVDLAFESSYFRAGPVLREGISGHDMVHIGLRTRYVF